MTTELEQSGKITKDELKAIIWPTLIAIVAFGSLFFIWPHTDMYQEGRETVRLQLTQFNDYDAAKHERLMNLYSLTEVDLAPVDILNVSFTNTPMKRPNIVTQDVSAFEVMVAKRLVWILPIFIVIIGAIMVIRRQAHEKESS